MDREKMREEMKTFMESVEEKKNSFEDLLPKKKPLVESKAKHAEYFEGQIQLRNITPEVLTYVQNRIIEEGAQVPTKKEHSEGNIDYWVSDKKLLHKLVKELKDRFGGFSKESAQHFSFDHQTSKNIYRLNVYFEMHKHKVSDVVSLFDSPLPFIVVSYKKERLLVKDVVSLKKQLVYVTEIDSILEKHRKKIVTVTPSYMILDTNYQAVPLRVPEGVSLQMDENVVVVQKDNEWYFIKS